MSPHISPYLPLAPQALPRGVNGLFWEERRFGDGGSYHYSPQLGEMRLAPPPTMHGGLLCDEMGLGKTLEIVGLVVASLARDAEAAAAAGGGGGGDDDEADEAEEPMGRVGLIPSKATLIVAPPTLVSQWLAEVAKSTTPTLGLRLAKYTHDDLIRRDNAGAWRARAAALAANDIVLTTYPALDKCTTVLGAVAWRRVVLDEMQEVLATLAVALTALAALATLATRLFGCSTGALVDDRAREEV